MSDVFKLMQQHGAPLPNAAILETEVRTEGSIAFKTLNVPSWVDKVKPSSGMGEWRCTLTHGQLDQLQALLKTVLPLGNPLEQVLNETFQALDIGSYTGTFVEEGLLVDGAATIRVLFAFRSTTFTDIAGINRAIHNLLINPGQYAEASDALQKLRDIWRSGTNKWEGGLMMLSEVSLFDPSQFPYTRAKLDAP